MPSTRNKTLLLIALFKLFKSVALIAIGISALHLIHGDAVATLTHWLDQLGIDPDSRYVDQALSRIGNLSPSRFKELGIASFVYSALFLVEGTGLFLQKPWAEWFTTIITGSLIPLEVYELLRRPTAGKTGMLLVNGAIVVYLILQIRKRRAKEAR